jgi:hypothetical protein
MSNVQQRAQVHALRDLVTNSGICFSSCPIVCASTSIVADCKESMRDMRLCSSGGALTRLRLLAEEHKGKENLHKQQSKWRRAPDDIREFVGYFIEDKIGVRGKDEG